MSLRIDKKSILEKLLEKCKTIWSKIETLKILNWMLYPFMMINV